MNKYPIELDIDAQNTRVCYYLIEKDQVEKEWLDRLESLYTHNVSAQSEEGLIDFRLTVIVACVEHFTGDSQGFREWAEDLRETVLKGDLDSYDITEVQNFDEGCKLMDEWIQPEFRSRWKAQTDRDPIVVKEPILHIRHRCD